VSETPVTTKGYRPPAPQPLSALRSLWRVIRQGDGDLLSLVPIEGYHEPQTFLGYSRRSILLVNDPDLCRYILADPLGIFPKNDLMVGALEGLVGESLFVSSGELWQRQRRMIDPAFSHMRIQTAFASMVSAVDDYEQRLARIARDGTSLSLDMAMSHLTADIICRTIFSTPLTSSTARQVFNDFMVFERGVASVNLRQLIFGKPWGKISQPHEVVAACQRIREQIGHLLDPRLQGQQSSPDDIVQAVIDARDPETGIQFTREEIIDQIGVFFLAGHETTASVLTWVFFILSQQPGLAAQLRKEIAAVVGHNPIKHNHIKQLDSLKNVFREALRLYPPITFIPRVAQQATKIGDTQVKRGAMIMISPWTAHRNAQLWQNAEQFEPTRFASENKLHNHDKGVLMSFGIGPRVCVGASFATTESVLIIARLLARFDFMPQEPDKVRPVARLTTRPASEIQCTVVDRKAIK